MGDDAASKPVFHINRRKGRSFRTKLIGIFTEIPLLAKYHRLIAMHQHSVFHMIAQTPS
jgi:hypothetical protein